MVAKLMHLVCINLNICELVTKAIRDPRHQSTHDSSPTFEVHMNS
jgi:hypothetical protein